MKFNPVRRTLPALAMLAAALLAGCSQAPEIGISANQPGDLFAQAADAAFKGDLNYVKACVEGDARYLEAYDANGRSLLHYAAEGGHAAVVRYLLEKGAYANFEDNDGYYPLDAASQGGASREVMDLIREALAREAGRY
ncbi:MAG: ankyrin repeat domain-containing protein [Candidatus Hydrogenedentes bacterium]|nr:ankyrin repeat domain-containing protein [Candidatus Hydrogenedentota bacterium]